ncbi:hypothetical protein DW68_009355 [Ectopseudomonas mendocina S5.2]|uniref:Uncharacterized protein n=1 Tax=Ectopseudomonas mendocina S5.2 TaxID=1225174 RepID=A0ABN4IV47_ECTME|nr:hypothetical protein DW68_009355 [Pseudomonas mendocina S5.2]
MLFGRCPENFRTNFTASLNSVENRQTFALQETCLHGYFHLARTDNAGPDHSLRTQVANIDLFTRSAIRQGFARHSYVHCGAPCADDDLIATTYNFCDLQMAGSQNLIST